MKLNALALLVCVNGAYAVGDKELARQAPTTVGQALMHVLKTKFKSKPTVQTQFKELQGKPVRARNNQLDDARQLLNPGQYNLSHDVV